MPPLAFMNDRFLSLVTALDYDGHRASVRGTARRRRSKQADELELKPNRLSDGRTPWWYAWMARFWSTHHAPIRLNASSALIERHEKRPAITPFPPFEGWCAVGLLFDRASTTRPLRSYIHIACGGGCAGTWWIDDGSIESKTKRRR